VDRHDGGRGQLHPVVLRLDLGVVPLGDPAGEDVGQKLSRQAELPFGDAGQVHERHHRREHGRELDELVLAQKAGRRG
jgi:hypothetical protein